MELLDNIACPNSEQPFQNEEGFNYTWITSLLDTVLKQVKEDCYSKGKELHWIAFDKRFREPVFENSPAPTLTEICQNYGIENEVKASSMVASVKRLFQKMLRSHIREYVYTDQDVDEELSELLSFLNKNLHDDK